jgi:double-stranded uracil-DNA glycosylase
VPRFTRAELDAYAGAVIADLVGDRVKLLFVGINPGLWTAAVQTHFAHPANRFYPALLAAGIIERPIDPAAGMTDDDRAYFIGRGLGVTNLVPRASARADELSDDELREGGARLVDRVRVWQPDVVAVAGITAYRTAFGARTAKVGRQQDPMAASELWVVPNPSGLNAHETVATLATAYRAAAEAAGVV